MLKMIKKKRRVIYNFSNYFYEMHCYSLYYFNRIDYGH